MEKEQSEIDKVIKSKQVLFNIIEIVNKHIFCDNYNIYSVQKPMNYK